MYKRTVVVFTVFCLCLGLLIVNMISIYDENSMEAASVNSSKTLVVSKSRGNIYDCNMKKIVNSRTEYIACVKPTSDALAAMSKVLDYEKQKELSEKLSGGYPVAVKVDVPYIDCDDVTVVQAYGRYTDNQPLAHVIGYIDAQTGQGTAGIEKSYDSLLAGFAGKISVSYTADARGRVLNGSKAVTKNENYNCNGGVKLTIDLSVQQVVERCIEQAKLESGAVVVLEAGTGKIRAMASCPAYNPNDLSQSLSSENSPFVNKAVTAYSVGSVFKLVVAAAAVEAGISPSYSYDCTGSIDAGGVTVHCHKLDGHGTLNMSNAFALSCNTYFINLANQIGAEAIVDMAERMGFGRAIKLAEDFVSDGGILPSCDEITSEAALANLAFGQGTLMATPLQLAAVYSCVANGGKYYEPFLVESAVDENGNETTVNEIRVPSVVFSAEVSRTLTSYLKNSVDNGGGSLAKPENGTAAGKTATAQTGWYDADGTEYYHAWFCGFYPAENPKYVICVMKEKGRGGSVDCAPIFKLIADGLG